MQETRVAGLGFDRVSDRVAEIQDTAQIAFFLIRRDHFGFDAYGRCNQSIQGPRFLRQYLIRTQFEHAKQFGIADDRALDHLIKSGPILAHGEARKCFGINQHGHRLMKTADQIFSAREIHAGFATDGCVYLGE